MEQRIKKCFQSDPELGDNNINFWVFEGLETAMLVSRIRRLYFSFFFFFCLFGGDLEYNAGFGRIAENREENRIYRERQTW